MLVFPRRPSWLRLVFSYRGSPLPRVRFRLAFVFLFSAAITVVQERLRVQSPLNPQVLSLVGIALGIFLGFRNSATFERFADGRRLWGRIVNTSRSYCRTVMILLGNGEPASDEIKELVLPVLAFVHALRLQLRSGGDIQEAKRFLPAEAHAAFERSANKPNQALLWLGEQLRLARAKNRLSEYGLIELARLLTDLSDAQGGCERIKNTPIPHSYTILIHQIVGLYVLALPFALVSTLHFVTPLVTLAIAYTFLGLDALGDEIEDPFGYDYNDLPLSAICRTIEVNLLEALSEVDIPPLSRPERGVLL